MYKRNHIKYVIIIKIYIKKKFLKREKISYHAKLSCELHGLPIVCHTVELTLRQYPLFWKYGGALS